MHALSILPSPHHKYLDYDDFAFASGSFDHDFSFKIKIDNEKLEEEEDDEQEFNFTCVIREEMLVSADEIFHDGKIRALFPVLDKAHYGAKMGLFQDVSLKTSKEMMMRSKKSNSTGFSKMLRCRQDLQLQSYSNGKDAFVFLNPPKKLRNDDDAVKNAKRKMTPPSSSPHEKLYMMNRKRKESEKRRSFLPYKQHLFGFFANMNFFSNNIHPF